MTYRASRWRRKDVKELRKTISVAAATVLLVGALGAAPAIAQDDEVLIGYAAPGLVGAQLQIQQGLVDGAAAKGWEVQTVTSNNDANLQIEQIRDYLALGVDAIVAVPEDSAGICVAVAEAAAQGVPFYTIDRAPTGCAINMTVLSDNFLAGQQSGEAAVAWLTEKYGEPKGNAPRDHRQHGPERGPAARWWLPRHRGRVSGHRSHHQGSVTGRPSKGVDIVRDVASAEDLDGIYMHSDCVYTPGHPRDAGRAGPARPA